jgi:hypothetical protein
MKRALVALFLVAGCASDDFTVRVVPRGSPAPDGAWDSVAFNEIGSECVFDTGRVYFRRPAYTLNPAEWTCYSNGQATILVPMRFPNAAYNHEGWTRCDATAEQRAIACCKARPDELGHRRCQSG